MTVEIHRVDTTGLGAAASTVGHKIPQFAAMQSAIIFHGRPCIMEAVLWLPVAVEEYMPRAYNWAWTMTAPTSETDQPGELK